MPGDLDKLQGCWNVTALRLDGRTMPAAGLQGAGIVIEENRFTSLGMGAAYAGTVKLNSTRKPKTLDLLFTEGHAAGTRHPGIYRLVGDRWTLCLATSGERRPPTFASTAGSGFALETLERSEPTPVAIAPAAGLDAFGLEPLGPPTEWEGEWAMVSAVSNGGTMSADMVRWAKRVTRGDITTVTAGGQAILQARFTLDPSTNPGSVNYLHLLGPHIRKTQEGIFERHGDLLKVCMAPPRKPRPSEFSSTSGDGRAFTTWRREKT